MEVNSRTHEEWRSYVGDDYPRWRDFLPEAHAGSCRWINHPTHKARIWIVYLAGELNWSSIEYWLHTPKLCRKCWRRMKRIPLSMSGYKCPNCGTVRHHSDYITYSVKVGK